MFRDVGGEMSFNRLLSITTFLLLSQFAVCALALTSLPQDQDFTAKVVDLTLSEISEKGPSREAASFVSRSMDLLWPRRSELLKATSPHFGSPDPSKATSAMEILYRLRSYRPMASLGFDEGAWERENSDFFSEVDALVYRELPRLLASREDSLLRNLALYLGSFTPSDATKRALLELAKNPEVGEQALICLTWHKDKRDMDDLMPFMLHGGREVASLPYHFRNSYGQAAMPYLLSALAEASSPFVRLQSARELVLMGERAGVRYLYEAVLHRDELPNGRAQAEEIRVFAWGYMGFPKQSTTMDDLVTFLRGKL
jgi:hypothetical protein